MAAKLRRQFTPPDFYGFTQPTTPSDARHTESLGTYEVVARDPEFMVVSAALDIPRFPQEPPRLSWQKTPGHLAGFGICRLPNVAQRIFTRYRLALINKKIQL